MQVVDTSDWELSNAAQLCDVIPHCAHQKLELLRNIPRVTGQKVDYITIFFKVHAFGNTVVDMNSQLLRLHAQDLNKTKPIKLSECFREGIMKFH